MSSHSEIPVDSVCPEERDDAEDVVLLGTQAALSTQMSNQQPLALAPTTSAATTISSRPATNASISCTRIWPLAVAVLLVCAIALLTTSGSSIVLSDSHIGRRWSKRDFSAPFFHVDVAVPDGTRREIFPLRMPCEANCSAEDATVRWTVSALKRALASRLGIHPSLIAIFSNSHETSSRVSEMNTEADGSGAVLVPPWESLVRADSGSFGSSPSLLSTSRWALDRVDAVGVNVSSLLYAAGEAGHEVGFDAVEAGLRRRYVAWRHQQRKDCGMILPLTAYRDTAVPEGIARGRVQAATAAAAGSFSAIVRPVKGDHIHVAFSMFVGGRRLATPLDMPQVGLHAAAAATKGEDSGDGGAGIHVSSVRPHVGIHSGNNALDGDDGLIHVHPGSAWSWLRGPTEGLGATLGVLLEVVGISVWDLHSPRYPQHVPLAAMESSWRSRGTTKWGQQPLAQEAANPAQQQHEAPGDGCLSWGPCIDSAVPLLYHHDSVGVGNVTRPPEAVPSQYSGYSSAEYDAGHTILCSNASHAWRLYAWRHYSELCDTWWPGDEEGGRRSSGTAAAAAASGSVSGTLAAPLVVGRCTSDDGAPTFATEEGLERLLLGPLADGAVSLSFEARSQRPLRRTGGGGGEAGYYVTPPVIVRPADLDPAAPATVLAGEVGSSAPLRRDSSRWPVPLQRTVDALHAHSIPVGFDGALYPATAADLAAFPFASPRWLSRLAAHRGQLEASGLSAQFLALLAEIATEVDTFGSYVCPAPRQNE